MVRPHDDPRFTASRLGQIQGRITSPIGQHLEGATVLKPRPEFRPYQWRNPARARDWARLPPDLIELMQAEGIDALPKTPAARPPGSGPPAGRGPTGPPAPGPLEGGRPGAPPEPMEYPVSVEPMEYPEGGIR